MSKQLRRVTQNEKKEERARWADNPSTSYENYSLYLL